MHPWDAARKVESSGCQSSCPGHPPPVLADVVQPGTPRSRASSHSGSSRGRRPGGWPRRLCHHNPRRTAPISATHGPVFWLTATTRGSGGVLAPRLQRCFPSQIDGEGK